MSMRAWLIIALLAWAAVICWVIIPRPAHAHAAMSGWRYDRDCCEEVEPGTGFHCAPIPTSAVRVIPGGFIVTLRPGDHPNVKNKVHTWKVMYGAPMYEGSVNPKIRISGDEDYHSCVFPTEETLRCLYVPMGGV